MTEPAMTIFSPDRALVTIRVVKGRLYAEYDEDDLDEAAKHFINAVTSACGGAA